MAELFEIRNEEDLFRAIDLCRDGEWLADVLPLFVDWTRYEITIRGEDFDGGVPTRIMPALLLLQRTINSPWRWETMNEYTELEKPHSLSLR